MIVLGYGLTKARIFDGQAGKGISLFVFNVAIPALLFKTVGTMEAQAGAPWSLEFARAVVIIVRISSAVTASPTQESRV